jgi:dTDP-4-amino-4,6-dideoxygalactose transaminase
VQYQGAPWPVYDEEQIDAVQRVLRSGKVNYWTGTEGRKFEEEFAESTGVKHAIFVANGTVALELAIRSLELPPGSDIVTTPRTFIASSSCIVLTGHRPVFADVDLDSGNITAESIQEALTPNTAAVLVVHLGGWPADMPTIRRLCDERGLALIEDCSQAHGAMIGDQHVGTFGDVAAWSFCQDKIITTGGEGGIVATNDRGLWDRMWSFKDHGKSYEAVYERSHPPGFRWFHDSFGTNARGTEMQAAIGRIQYRRLTSWREARARNAKYLASGVSQIQAVRVPLPGTGVTHGFYRLYAYVNASQFAPGWTRDRLIGEMQTNFQVSIGSGSCPAVYKERAFDPSELEAAERTHPNAETLGLESIALLTHPGLTESDHDRVLDALAITLARAVDSAQLPGEHLK